MTQHFHSSFLLIVVWSGCALQLVIASVLQLRVIRGSGCVAKDLINALFRLALIVTT